MTNAALEIILEFGGGAELLFDNLKKRVLTFQDKSSIKMSDFLVYMKDNLLRERPELFLQNDSVRPGILVLVNDTDWELLGELEYEIQHKDNVLFISTLHGG